MGKGGFQVFELPSFWEGERAGGRTNAIRDMGTDHVISGPMGGLKKLHQTDRTTDGHGGSMTKKTKKTSTYPHSKLCKSHQTKRNHKFAK